MIRVGNGTTVGVATFLAYTDPSAVPVHYIASSGWDASGTAIIIYGEIEMVTFNYCINSTVPIKVLQSKRL